MDPQPQQVFLSQTSRKLNSLNPFAQQYFDLFGLNLTHSMHSSSSILCLILVLENIFRKPQLVDESSRILAGNVKVQFRYKHLSSIIFRPFD